MAGFRLQVSGPDMKNNVAVVCAIVLGRTAATLQLQIPTGGPIPDRRGFHNRVNDPKAVAAVRAIVRHVAGRCRTFTRTRSRGPLPIAARCRPKKENCR
jgi:hypothetical protein